MACFLVKYLHKPLSNLPMEFSREGYPGAEMADWHPPTPETEPEEPETKGFVESQSPAIPDKALDYEAIRSSGAGGQNVNKVSSKIRLRLSVGLLDTWSDRQKQLLRDAAGNRWKPNEDVIIIECQEQRDQHQNKRLVNERLTELTLEALTPVKERKATKPSRRQKAKRMDDKSHQGRKKEERRGSQDGW
jgi:ribosome-associated protein